MQIYDNPEFFQAYSQMDRSKFGLSAAGEWHQLEKLFPDLTGADVLDLGCGYGWHSRYCAEHGAASVLGIDASEAMITEAKRRNLATTVTYRICALEDYDYPGEVYDFVLSNLVLHYVEDLNLVFQKVYHALKPMGVFLFNIEAPIHRAIIDGYSKTGITIMYMAEGMDNGDIISQREVLIDEDDTASSLHDKLKVVGRDLLLETLPSIIDGTNSRTSQDESLVTYGFNISKDDERLDFNVTSKKLYDKVRGLNSWPGAYCMLDGKRLKVWECYRTGKVFDDKLPGEITSIYSDGFGVNVSNGEVVFKVVQPEGKKAMLASDFINGYHESLVGKILE